MPPRKILSQTVDSKAASALKFYANNHKSHMVSVKLSGENGTAVGFDRLIKGPCAVDPIWP